MEPNSSNQINWSDPNYWTGWNNTFGSLGGAIGQWVNAFDGNNPQMLQIPPQQPQNNTALYIGFGILALLLIIIIVVLFKKS